MTTTLCEGVIRNPPGPGFEDEAWRDVCRADGEEIGTAIRDNAPAEYEAGRTGRGNYQGGRTGRGSFEAGRTGRGDLGTYDPFTDTVTRPADRGRADPQGANRRRSTYPGGCTELSGGLPTRSVRVLTDQLRLRSAGITAEVSGLGKIPFGDHGRSGRPDPHVRAPFPESFQHLGLTGRQRRHQSDDLT